MTKTELLDRAARSRDERLLLARALDQLELTRQRNVPAHTDFLSPQERAAVEALLCAVGHPPHLFFGGYDGAERTICAFLPDWQTPEAWLADCPVSALRARFPAEAGLTHRDFLGALMGLGITREKLGDFLVDKQQCDLVILNTVEAFLLQNCDTAGRTRLQLAPVPLTALAAQPVEGKIIRDTVATLRLDAVVSSAFSVSRGKAADFITAGRVRLNHSDCVKTDRAVAQGDVISCRGLGKCVLRETGGLSKKGRIMLVLERY